jgi:uncharacterized membrane protein YbhN (UPF0104 family)
MRRIVRFGVGVFLGGAAFAGYLAVVGVDDVGRRLVAVTPAVVVLVFCLVVAEGLADGVGVWASVRPLGDGLTAVESVQFALAGDFFDSLSPAGPVSSEPIMARFIAVTTDTTYSDALAVRGVAKYVKSGTQLLVSSAVGVVFLFGGPSPQFVLGTLGVSLVGVVAAGAVVVRFRRWLSKPILVVATPVVSVVSSRLFGATHDRDTVAAALSRFWARVLRFRSTPLLLVAVGVGGVLEQALTGLALWMALAGTGSPVSLLPLVAVVPLPQVASVVPVPASIGAYDVLLGGAIVVMTTASPTAAAAAVLLVRTLSVPFGVTAGGVAAALLRGWRPGA